MKGYMFTTDGATMRWVIMQNSLKAAIDQLKQSVEKPEQWYFIQEIGIGDGILYESSNEYVPDLHGGTLIKEITFK